MAMRIREKSDMNIFVAKIAIIAAPHKKVLWFDQKKMSLNSNMIFDLKRSAV